MKKKSIFAAFVTACLSLSSCGFGGTTGTTDTASSAASILGGILSNDGSGTSILGSLLEGLLGGGTLTQKNLIGTWTYQAPKVAFESENLLSKAGGAVVANKVEDKLNTYLSKVGIKQGVSTFTFNQDGTYTIQTKGTTVSSGTYSYNPNSKTIQMSGMLGLTNLNCSVGVSGSYIYLMFGADKLLSGANSVLSALGSSVLSSVLGSYDGMQIGFTLAK